MTNEPNITVQIIIDIILLLYIVFFTYKSIQEYKKEKEDIKNIFKKIEEFKTKKELLEQSIKQTEKLIDKIDKKHDFKD